MIMLKDIDADIRKLSVKGMYYRDMAPILKVSAIALQVYMRDKGIPRNLKRKSRTGDE